MYSANKVYETNHFINEECSYTNALEDVNES